MRCLLHLSVLYYMTLVLWATHVSSPDPGDKDEANYASSTKGVSGWITTPNPADKRNYQNITILPAEPKEPMTLIGRPLKYKTQMAVVYKTQMAVADLIRGKNDACRLDRIYHRENNYVAWKCPMEWQEAVKVCEVTNATLFAPSTVEEMNGVFGQISPEVYWIGLQRESEQRKAHWNGENGINLSKMVLINGSSFLTNEYLENYGKEIRTSKTCGAVITSSNNTTQTVMIPCDSFINTICKRNIRPSYEEYDFRWVYYNHSWYHVTYASEWQRAVELCQQINSSLFVPRTVEEMEAVFKRVPSHEIYWIGLQRESEHKQPHWNEENGIDITKISFINSSFIIHRGNDKKVVASEKTCGAVFPFITNKQLTPRTLMYPCNKSNFFICKEKKKRAAGECSTTWQEAVLQCSGRYSLFVPNSIEEMEAVFKHVDAFKTYWIGLSRENKREQPHWIEENGMDLSDLLLVDGKSSLIPRYLESNGKMMGTKKTCGAMIPFESSPRTLMYPCNNLNYFVCKKNKKESI